MQIGLRPLPLAEEVVATTGLKVTFAYDDLVFVEHNAFLLRFNDEKPEQLFLHFNNECEESEKSKLIRMLEAKAFSLGMQIVKSTNYTMKQIEGTEEFQVFFAKG